MKKTVQHALVIGTTSLAGCFLFACSEPKTEEKPQVLVADSLPKNTAVPQGGVAVKEEEPLARVNTAALTADENITSLSELNKSLTKKASFFVISTRRDTVIKCRQGTLLSIPANAFLNAANPNTAVSEVKITVKEFYSLSDMIVGGLTTASGSRLLETGGMINIKASSGRKNDSCILRPGKNIAIAMTRSDKAQMEGMQLFNGVHDSLGINWMPRSGVAGLAQLWKGGADNPVQYLEPLDAGLVFPEEPLAKTPVRRNVQPEQIQAQAKVPLRELLQNGGFVTRRANAYIDTAGNVKCYKIGTTRQDITFEKIYVPSTYQNVKVNLAADINVSYQSKLDPQYFLKLFKMGAGNPDSLISLTVNLRPGIKMTGSEKLKTVLPGMMTMEEYQKKQRRRARMVREYENKVKQLRLDKEARLKDMERNATTDLQSAQDYMLLSTSQLGWINCDRFYNYPEKVDYVVKLNGKTSLLMVFNNIKSILAGDANGVFRNVPLHEKITLVALKAVDGKLMMAVQETTVTDQPFEQLSFQKVSIKEYKSKLEKLNSL